MGSVPAPSKRYPRPKILPHTPPIPVTHAAPTQGRAGRPGRGAPLYAGRSSAAGPARTVPPESGPVENPCFRDERPVALALERSSFRATGRSLPCIRKPKGRAASSHARRADFPGGEILSATRMGGSGGAHKAQMPGVAPVASDGSHVQGPIQSAPKQQRPDLRPAFCRVPAIGKLERAMGFNPTNATTEIIQ